MTLQAQLSLVENLGFTPVEASVYISLLKDSPQTGYKISTDLCKSRSQTYQALKSLETKRAIIRLEGTQHGEYIPVPIQTLMEEKEKEFKQQKTDIITALKDIGTEPHQEHIFRIAKLDQLYNKAESMIKEAKSMILVDTDQAPLENIHHLLNARAQEGIKVLIETPNDPIIDSCYHVKLNMFSAKDFAWNADWLCLSIDGEQFLISLLKKDTGELIHAIWSGNPYLSPWVFNGMLNEFSFRVIMDLLETGTDLQTVRNNIQEYTQKFFQPVPGIIKLLEKLKENN